MMTGRNGLYFLLHLGRLSYTIGFQSETLSDLNKSMAIRVFSLMGYYIIKCHIESVSTNQRPGQPSWFFHQPENHRLPRGLCDLASCQVSLNSV